MIGTVPTGGGQTDRKVWATVRCDVRKEFSFQTVSVTKHHPSAPVGPERSRPSGVSSQSSRPHHRRTYQSSLVAGPRTDTVLYKPAVLTHKALHGGAPRYLSSLVHVADMPDRRALCCAGSNRLQIPPFKLSTVGGRAFPVAAARFWNRLSDNVTSANSLLAFQRQLKHTLFQQLFPDIIL